MYNSVSAVSYIILGIKYNRKQNLKTYKMQKMPCRYPQLLIHTAHSLLYLPYCYCLSALVLPPSLPLLLHLLADLLVALRSDEHLDAGLIHIVDVGPVSLDLGVFYAAGQAVDGPRRPGDHRNKYWWKMKQEAEKVQRWTRHSTVNSASTKYFE